MIKFGKPDFLSVPPLLAGPDTSRKLIVDINPGDVPADLRAAPTVTERIDTQIEHFLQRKHFLSDKGFEKAKKFFEHFSVMHHDQYDAARDRTMQKTEEVFFALRSFSLSKEGHAALHTTASALLRVLALPQKETGLTKQRSLLTAKILFHLRAYAKHFSYEQHIDDCTKTLRALPADTPEYVLVRQLLCAMHATLSVEQATLCVQILEQKNDTYNDLFFLLLPRATAGAQAHVAQKAALIEASLKHASADTLRVDTQLLGTCAKKIPFAATPTISNIGIEVEGITVPTNKNLDRDVGDLWGGIPSDVFKSKNAQYDQGNVAEFRSGVGGVHVDEAVVHDLASVFAVLTTRPQWGSVSSTHIHLDALAMPLWRSALRFRRGPENRIPTFETKEIPLAVERPGGYVLPLCFQAVQFADQMLVAEALYRTDITALTDARWKKLLGINVQNSDEIHAFLANPSVHGASVLQFVHAFAPQVLPHALRLVSENKLPKTQLVEQLLLKLPHIPHELFFAHVFPVLSGMHPRVAEQLIAHTEPFTVAMLTSDVWIQKVWSVQADMPPETQMALLRHCASSTFDEIFEALIRAPEGFFAVAVSLKHIPATSTMSFEQLGECHKKIAHLPERRQEAFTPFIIEHIEPFSIQTFAKKSAGMQLSSYLQKELLKTKLELFSKEELFAILSDTTQTKIIGPYLSHVLPKLQEFPFEELDEYFAMISSIDVDKADYGIGGFPEESRRNILKSDIAARTKPLSWEDARQHKAKIESYSLLVRWHIMANIIDIPLHEFATLYAEADKEARWTYGGMKENISPFSYGDLREALDIYPDLLQYDGIVQGLKKITTAEFFALIDDKRMKKNVIVGFAKVLLKKIRHIADADIVRIKKILAKKGVSPHVLWEVLHEQNDT